MKEAFVDITPIKNEIALTLPSENGPSKKRRKKDNEIRRNVNGSVVNVYLKLHQKLCAKALEFLKNLLIFCGAALKPVLLKILQEKILGISLKFLSQELSENDLYDSFECRSQMLELTGVILMHPPIRNVTPMSYSIEVLTKFKEKDRDVRLRKRAVELIRNLEAVLHNRKDPIHFPTDLHEFRDSWLFNEKTVNAFNQLSSEMWRVQESGEEAKTNGGEIVLDDDEEVGEVTEDPKEKISNENHEKEEIFESDKEEKEESSKEEEKQISDDKIVKNIEIQKKNSPQKISSPKNSNEIASTKIEKEKLLENSEKQNQDVDETVDSYFADFDCT